METIATSDSELLSSWVEQRCESAFHALVARYAVLVHMAAKRTSGDESLAAEASQLVFILLARKAKSLTSHPSLAGWLHVTAVLKTRDLIDKARRESRKRQHLAMEAAPSHAPHDTWREMQPVLDDALAALSDKDREALLLRFYRALTIREVAATLGIATDAAQKRIDRATERLRSKLIRRGCQSGGTLAATLLTGFAADAQAALPVSMLASKAIAAGAVSSFSLTANITSIAALMKSSSLIPPVVALVLAGAWTGTKYHSLSATEARNVLRRDKIAAARSVKTPALIIIPKDDGPIDWQKLATEGNNGPEMQRFQKRLKSMTREEMIEALDQIAALGLSNGRRTELESVVVWPLMQIDPEWVLNRFKNRLRLSHNDQGLSLHMALGFWAKRDLGRATAWFDAQIAAGNFNSKQLNENSWGQTRHKFEAILMNILLASDPASAARRLSAIPMKQREMVMRDLSIYMKDTPLAEGNHLAFANLIRSQLPPDLQSSILLEGHSSVQEEDNCYPQFAAYMDKIEATAAERISCIEEFSAGKIRSVSDKRNVTLDDLEIMRGQFEKISPHAVDVMMARSLALAVKGRHSSMLFPQASEIAVKYLETSGNDAVLVAFLEIADFDKPDKKLGRELAGKISDVTRRAEILKRFN